MAITKATNLAAVGSGLGTSPSQPIDIGIGITLDGNSGVITASKGNFGTVSIDGNSGVITASKGNFGTVSIDGSATGLGPGATGSNLSLTADLSARHINALGVVTATQFSGNISGVAATFAGNVTVGGTLTYDDVTNVDSIGLITARNGLQVTGGITTISGQANLSNTTITGVTTITNVVIPNESRFSNVAEKMVRVSASSSVGVCTYTSTANIIYFDNPSADVVIRVEGIPTDSSFDNHSISVSAILRTTGTGRSCHTFVRLNGVERAVKFAGGSRNEATSGVTTTNGYTVYNFVGVNTIGSASSAANYEVFGIVSGGFF
jgi:hypothetical protein